MSSYPEIEKSIGYSERRIEEVRNAFTALDAVSGSDQLAVYVTGSYGRGEAGPNSDIDLFFLHNGSIKTQEEKRKEMEKPIFKKIVEICEELSFPELTPEFLSIHYVDDLFPEVGSREDDHMNFFTARVLMFLEGVHIYNGNIYEDILGKIIDIYYRDYETYGEKFFPAFLINDIIRYWKTLCLNYENRCINRKNGSAEDFLDVEFSARKDLLKLKYSRLITCYSMILTLAFHGDGITTTDVEMLIANRPLKRLGHIKVIKPEECSHVDELIRLYESFLVINHMEREKYKEYLLDEVKYTKLLDDGMILGGLIYGLVVGISEKDSRKRFLVV